jgi:hypothetical protein
VSDTSNYARLRQAVLAYDRALTAYGIVGEAWVDRAPELDRLYAEMLAAAEPEPDAGD